MPKPPSTQGALAGYIFKNYEALFTDDERAAYRTIVEGRLCGPKAAVDALLSDGELSFYDRVTRRVMTAHRNSIVLNRCPKCKTLCRTPSARVCQNPQCNHTWFEDKKSTEQAGGTLRR
jgi:hypothetical protein